MKKSIWWLALISVFLLLFAVGAMAQTPWPDRGGDKVLKADKDAEAVSNFRWGPNNLSGDVAVLFQPGESSSFAGGVGLDVLNYKQGLFTLRAELFASSEDVLDQEDKTVAGVAVLVNLIKLVGLIPDTSWLANAINPSIGLFAGYDFDNGKMTYGPMLSIINVQW